MGLRSLRGATPALRGMSELLQSLFSQQPTVFRLHARRMTAGDAKRSVKEISGRAIIKCGRKRSKCNKRSKGFPDAQAFASLGLRTSPT